MTATLREPISSSPDSNALTYRTDSKANRDGREYPTAIAAAAECLSVHAPSGAFFI